MENKEMLLQIEELRKAFGGLTVTNGINLQFKKEELACIIGPNGAGKTTFFNLLTGHLRPDSGKVIFKGEDISRLSPYHINRKGIGRSFQRVNIFTKLNVFENVQLALLCGKGESLNFFSPMKNLVREQTRQILTQVRLTNQATAFGGELSHGDQKRLEIALAIANRPELLLLDEPTAGMSAEETKATVQLIGDLFKNQRGLSIVVIEHDMDVVFSVAQRIVVLHQGAVIADGKPEEIRKNEQVQKVYFGEKRWEY